jgi:hypothetical protein
LARGGDWKQTAGCAIATKPSLSNRGVDLPRAALKLFLFANCTGTRDWLHACFNTNAEAVMSHWRKRNPSAGPFSALLARLSIALIAIFGVLLMLSLHGHA